MNKALLKEIILEQKKQIEAIDLGIEREKLKSLQKHFKLPHALVIAGIRRVGKSTLLAQIMRNFYQDKCYYFNFEDERLLDFEQKDFNLLYETFVELFEEKKVFFLDEIQNIKGWESFVRRMQDKKFKFFITGSNASLLSRELGSKLTGRFLSCELYSFSFREYLTFKNIEPAKNWHLQTEERARIKSLFNQYSKQGGMPEYLRYKEKEILKNIYENILYRDIVARHDIKEVKSLRELTLYLVSNLSNLFSYNNLKKILKLGSVNTVKKFVDYLENSFLIFTTNLFSYSLKQQIVCPKKVYCIDNGLANAISFKFSENRGWFLENLVFLELKRQGEEVYYYKTKNNSEIDFVLRQGSSVKQAIQVTQDASKEREIKSLVEALKELELKQGLILTEDEEEEKQIDGKTIIIKPIYKWLLEI
ncbi:MAG: ATP-binding protein [bacterium]